MHQARLEAEVWEGCIFIPACIVQKLREPGERSVSLLLRVDEPGEIGVGEEGHLLEGVLLGIS